MEKMSPFFFENEKNCAFLLLEDTALFSRIWPDIGHITDPPVTWPMWSKVEKGPSL